MCSFEVGYFSIVTIEIIWVNNNNELNITYTMD